MIVYNGTFTKKDGTTRTMTFVRKEHWAQVSDRLATILENSHTKKLPEGLELVWDLKKDAFRVFNWNSVIGDVTSTEQ